MTVCVAALCTDPGGNVVVGAADRMLTAGSTEYEAPVQKTWAFSTSILALCAGDMEFQTELLLPVHAKVGAAIQAAPEVWWNVDDVAKLYRDCYLETKRTRAETEVLAPLGLTTETFLARQKDFNTDLVLDLVDRLRAFQVPDAETIFMGVDNTGAHVIRCSQGQLAYCDGVRFTSIGSGWAHADSELMSAPSSAFTKVLETVTVVHSAKKRAEAAPGVGTATDLFVIGPSLGAFANVGLWEEGGALRVLDREYTKRVARERKAAAKLSVAFRSYLQSIVAKPQTAASSDPTSAAEAPSAADTGNS